MYLVTIKPLLKHRLVETLLSRLYNGNNNNAFVKTFYIFREKLSLHLILRKKYLCICKGNEKIPFHFPTKEEIARTAFWKKIETTLKLSLYKYLYQISTTKVWKMEPIENICLTWEKIYHFLILKSFGVSAYIFCIFHMYSSFNSQQVHVYTMKHKYCLLLIF